MEVPLSEILKLETRLPLHLVEINEGLLGDIEAHGIEEPILIMLREDNSMVVWDGLNRLAIAARLNLEKVPVRYSRMGL